MTVAEFRHEVQDKLSVAVHRSGGKTGKAIVLQQCEDFLVEQFESAQHDTVPAAALRALLDRWKNVGDATIPGLYADVTALCDAAEQESP